jgi:hypothetical protein
LIYLCIRRATIRRQVKTNVRTRASGAINGHLLGKPEVTRLSGQLTLASARDDAWQVSTTGIQPDLRHHWQSKIEARRGDKEIDLLMMKGTTIGFVLG